MADPQPDPWRTDTADPARVFRLMFPAPAPRIDWRLFSAPEDFGRRLAQKLAALR